MSLIQDTTDGTIYTLLPVRCLNRESEGTLMGLCLSDQRFYVGYYLGMSRDGDGTTAYDLNLAGYRLVVPLRTDCVTGFFFYPKPYEQNIPCQGHYKDLGPAGAPLAVKDPYGCHPVY